MESGFTMERIFDEIREPKFDILMHADGFRKFLDLFSSDRQNPDTVRMYEKYFRKANVAIGDIVSHKKFGKGVIAEKDGDHVTVTFDSGDQKKLSVDWLFCNAAISSGAGHDGDTAQGTQPEENGYHEVLRLIARLDAEQFEKIPHQLLHDWMEHAGSLPDMDKKEEEVQHSSDQEVRDVLADLYVDYWMLPESLKIWESWFEYRGLQQTDLDGLQEGSMLLTARSLSKTQRDTLCMLDKVNDGTQSLVLLGSNVYVMLDFEDHGYSLMDALSQIRSFGSRLINEHPEFSQEVTPEGYFVIRMAAAPVEGIRRLTKKELDEISDQNVAARKGLNMRHTCMTACQKLNITAFLVCGSDCPS